MSPISDNLKNRKRNRLLVNTVFFTLAASSILWLLNISRELILPIILGIFLGYLLRPVFYFKSGPWFIKLAKTVSLFSIVFLIFYFSSTLIKGSLPGEHEKLELAVRLQYQLNQRFVSWMGITEAKPKGNSFYQYFHNDLDPLLAKVNRHLSLNREQRKQFSSHYKSNKNKVKVDKKYYEYYLSNLKIMKMAEAESEAIMATVESDAATESEGKGSRQGLALIIHLASTWLVFPLTMIFIILDRGQLRQAFMKIIPNRYFELTRNVLDQVDEALGKYIRGTIMECTLVGLTISLGMFLLGFNTKAVLLVGLVGGLTNAIPFVGPALAFLAGSVFALVAENIHPILPFVNQDNLLIGVMLVMLAAQTLDNAVYQPLVVGGAVNIHPLAVILGVFIGSMAFGFAGLLLAIPTIVIIKVVTETLYSGLKAYRII